MCQIVIQIMKGSEQAQQRHILMTYRSSIAKLLPTTYYDSDSGWGCMLRVGQMAIANLLSRHYSYPLKAILPLFWDNSAQPYSIQTFTLATHQLYPKKEQYEWYNPCEMGHIIKHLLEHQLKDLSVKVFLDNSLFLSEIPRNKEKVLLMVMIRIGLDEPEAIYLPNIEAIMKSRHFFTAMGGTPKHAHLFLRVQDKMLGYLDPHKTSIAAESIQEMHQKWQEYVSELEWIKLKRIDSSMGLLFVIKREEVDEFWKEMQQIKQGQGKNFFLYMEETPPQINEDDIIEINDQDLQ